MIDRFASPFHLLFLIQYLGHRLALLMILMTKATLSKNCSSKSGSLVHFAPLCFMALIQNTRM